MIHVDIDTEVNNADLALCLKMSEPRVRQLLKEGAVVKSGVNKFKLVESIHAYLKYKEKKSKTIQIADTGETVDFEKARAQKTHQEALLAEMKVKFQSGQYVEVKDVEQDVTKFVERALRVLDALHERVKGEHPDLSARALEAIEQECILAGQALCDFNEEYTRKAGPYK